VTTEPERTPPSGAADLQELVRRFLEGGPADWPDPSEWPANVRPWVEAMYRDAGGVRRCVEALLAAGVTK
jgi:hypothetical protein